MNWEVFSAARQLIAEEKYGPMFAEREAEEDAALARARRNSKDR